MEATKKERIELIVLSVIDLLAGILSIILSYLSVQIIAALASGATLFKAVKIAVQAKKAESLLRPVTKVIVKVLPIVATQAVKQIKKSKKEKITMKAFFAKLSKNLKNNPATIITIVLDSLLCGAGGFALCHFNGFAGIPAPYDLVVEILFTIIVWAGLSVLIAYLGYDNELFAIIRKYIKVIGKNSDNEIVSALDNICDTVEKARQKEAEDAEILAKMKAEEDAILAAIEAEEKAKIEAQAKAEAEKAEAEKQAKIAAYKLAHAVVEQAPVEQVAVVAEQPSAPSSLQF